MTRVIICFSSKGRKLIKKLNEGFAEAGMECAQPYICMTTGTDDTDPCERKAGYGPDDGFYAIGLDDFVRRGFENRYDIIFVGACGIAVRAIAPYVKDKLSDSSVVVIDDEGNFVIPILSGHAGGANKLAMIIAGILDAISVITTATDVGGAFSADVFARENNLAIRGREGIKKISARALEGKPVRLSIKDYPPKDAIDMIIADETDRQYSLLLSPKRYVVGMGMKKGYDPKAAEAFLLDLLDREDIPVDMVYAFATIDIKEDEEALLYLSRKYRIPLISYDAPLLEKAEGDFTGSEFVQKTTGVDNVCERAAYLAAQPGGRLVVRKQTGRGVTAAIAIRGGAEPDN